MVRNTPISKLVPEGTTAANQLIDLAYSMAIEPQRFGTLSTILESRLDKLESGDQSVAAELEGITDHFDRAFNLMERQGRRFNYATGSIRYIEADLRPSLLIYPTGTIFHSNAAAEKELGAENDTPLAPDMFEHGHHKRFLDDLYNLSVHDVDKIIGVYTVFAGKDDEPLKLSLSRTLDFNGDDIGRLCTFHFKWLPEMESDFQNAFGLTPVEMEVTRAIVSGVSLSDLAEQRGRSLATVRTQTKKLLAKIGLKSQTELACIYSGFTQFNNKSVVSTASNMTPVIEQDSWRKTAMLDLPGDRKLHYEMVGPEDGRPVLFFHGLVGGTVMSKAMRDQLDVHNIRLIMPWRPYFGHTSPDNGRRSNIDLAVRDSEHLLDDLDIHRCPIVSVIGGTIYAYAAQQHMPNRITALINTASNFPLTSQTDFDGMDASSRVSLYVARHMPGLLHAFMRSFIQKVDAGFDEEFVREHYNNSPIDFATMFHPDFKMPIRNNFPLQTAQGCMCFVRDIQIQASRWDRKIRPSNCPVTLVHGEEDRSYKIGLARQFISDKPNYTLVPVPNAGQLVYFQAPDVVFNMVASYLD